MDEDRHTALDQSRKFYTDVLCFRDGLRPPFKLPGYWLYRGGDEAHFGVVHLIGIDKDNPQGLVDYLRDKAEGRGPAAESVRAALPASVAFGARISANEWTDGGPDVDHAIYLSRKLKRWGADYVCVSSGSVDAGNTHSLQPGFQVRFASRIRSETGIVTRTVGAITEPRQAEDITANGHADVVALARAFLPIRDGVWRAAEE